MLQFIPKSFINFLEGLTISLVGRAKLANSHRNPMYNEDDVTRTAQLTLVNYLIWDSMDSYLKGEYVTLNFLEVVFNYFSPI